jgi:PBP1b-binding outer membrane lipoprotein LpoB
MNKKIIIIILLILLLLFSCYSIKEGYDNYSHVQQMFPNVKISLLPFWNFSVDIYDFL